MDRPLLTLREAAAASGNSYSTLRRRREAGAFPGATKDAARGWVVPVEDLLAAGIRLNAPAPPDPPAEDAPPVQAGTEPSREQLLAQLAAATTEARMLREMLARQEQTAVRERAAAEQNLGDLRRQVLMLTAAPEPTVYLPGQPTSFSGQPTGQPTGSPAAAQQRRWWQGGSARHRRD
jgi:hypothetical protein